MKLPKSSRPDSERRDARQFVSRLLVDRGSQIAIGVLFAALGSGVGIYRAGTDGGHEDFATYRLLPDGSDSRRRAANSARLQEMYPPMRPKVAAIISDMESHGWKPYVDPGIYRSKAEQMAKYRAGVSKVTWSFHNASSCDGNPRASSCTPGSLAADIIDANGGWLHTPKKYFLQLASAARNHGLETGITFGLNTKAKAPAKAALLKAIAERRFDSNVALGWDASHVQPRGFAISAARAGKRPKY